MELILNGTCILYSAFAELITLQFNLYVSGCQTVLVLGWMLAFSFTSIGMYMFWVYMAQVHHLAKSAACLFHS